MVKKNGGIEEIDSHMELCSSWYDSLGSPLSLLKTVSWGFPEEQVAMGRGSGFLPPQIFHGYSMGILWMDPPYVLIVGGGRASSGAGVGVHDFGVGQLGGDFTLGSAQGSRARICGVFVAASFSSVESCKFGPSLKAGSWLN